MGELAAGRRRRWRCQGHPAFHASILGRQIESVDRDGGSVRRWAGSPRLSGPWPLAGLAGWLCRRVPPNGSWSTLSTGLRGSRVRAWCLGSAAEVMARGRLVTGISGQRPAQRGRIITGLFRFVMSLVRTGLLTAGCQEASVWRTIAVPAVMASVTRSKRR